MKDNIIQINPGARTAPNRVQRIKQNLDPDLFPRMLASHQGHIQRAQAKRDRIIRDAQRQAEAERRSRAEAEELARNLGQLSIGSLLALTLTAALTI